MGARFERLRIVVAGAELAERAAAEAFDAGASGIEEREAESASDMRELWIYAPAAAAPAVARALEALRAEADAAALQIAAREPAPDEDWSMRWREGLDVVRISVRLAVRPPFVPDDAHGAPALVVEPGQAFGTGGHASTRLALAGIDALRDADLAGARVLDAGTGSGVLALAALRLGAASAVGFDLDAEAVREAARNAAGNALGARLRLFAGPIGALAPTQFDVALANLLRSELLPILEALAARVRPSGCMVLAGLLASERSEVEAALAAAGLAVEAEREQLDPTGDLWLGLTARRRAHPASR